MPLVAPSTDLASSAALRKHIRALCLVLLDAREADLDQSLNSDVRVEESLSKFISDPQESVIYIHKLSSSDPEDPSGTSHLIQALKTTFTKIMCDPLSVAALEV